MKKNLIALAAMATIQRVPGTQAATKRTVVSWQEIPDAMAHAHLIGMDFGAGDSKGAWATYEKNERGEMVLAHIEREVSTPTSREMLRALEAVVRADYLPTKGYARTI